MSAKKKNLQKGFPTGKRLLNQRTGLCLFLLFLVSGVLRYILTRATINMPTIYYDEGLYINIARSIFTEGKVLYRAQPISYVYLLYPLTLIPLFLLPVTVSLYRAAQLYNALMMASVVFPAYLLGKQLKLSKERAFLLAVLTAIIPELTICSFLTVESLYYPLMMWAFYLGAKILNEADAKKQTRLYLGFAAFTGLLYFAKPVCVIFGACFILLDLIRRIRDKRSVLPAVAALVIAVAVVALGYVVYGLCFGQTTLLNLYEKQTMDTSIASIPIILQSILYHMLAFVFACGGAHILLPIFERKRFPAEQRALLQVGVVSLLASIIGVAIMVVPFRYKGDGFMSPVHLRYLMFFVPLALGFLLSPVMAGRRKGSRAFLIVLLVTTALFIFPGAFRFYHDASGYYDAPALVTFCTHKLDSTYGIILMVFYVIHALVLFAANKKEWPLDKIVKRGCSALVVFFLVNSLFCYTSREIAADPAFEESAQELAEYLNGEDSAMVVTNNYYDDFRGYQIDTHVRKPVQMVVMDDVLLHVSQKLGIYEPFVPVVQSPNTSNNLTTDADTLIFDITTSDYVEFADNIETFEIGDYVIAKINRGERFFDTAIAGMDAFTLEKNKQATFLIFDPDILAEEMITVSFTLKAVGASSVVTFSASGETATINAGSNWEEYVVTLPLKNNNRFFYFTPSEPIQIYQYHTVR